MNHALPDELSEAISQVVETQFGLHFPRERWPELREGVAAAAVELGFPAPLPFAQRLVSMEAGGTEARALASHLTIGETYFFREPIAFEALTSRVLPRLAQERQGRAKRLRIWSAGCCTGEEPYSIAIALRDALPDIDEWQITILATDINPHFLHKAAVGIYGDWSFRGVADQVRQKWFRKTEDGRSEILPIVRQMVSFTCLNLAEDVYPSLLNNTNAMDLIFCRHVLMYFSPGQQRKAVRNLRASLVAGGLLLVSTAEASPALSQDFAPAKIPSVPLFRKEPPVPPVNGASSGVWLEPAPRAPAPPPAGLDHAREARNLANEGLLSAALAACDRALRQDRLVPGLHYLRGVILQEQNDLERAAAALQRALYLDHAFVVAHFALGHVRLRQGRGPESALCFANARAGLVTWAQDEVLPESDGMTAGRLLEILQAMEEVVV
ncbi:MAG TPA: protein-glutamate O-methyltransferase CheR [Chthoniobacteraceae bacterium]|jgi:chemotaxis protein methyltransferase CheR|nr:protein-glutamate O-methyltransferase CheR [Chthoniobacteraceae bacterium]